MKQCTRCGALKAASDFQVRRASPDGLTAACRECLRVYDRSRGFHGRPEYAAEYRAKYPGRRAAQVALCNAVRDGRVLPWPVCAVPECVDKPEAHHPNYDAPLDVVWLCPAHHKQTHALIREAA